MPTAALPPCAQVLAASERPSPAQIRRLRLAVGQDVEERTRLTAVVADGGSFGKDKVRLAIANYAIGRFADAEDLIESKDAYGQLVLGLMEVELGEFAEAKAHLAAAAKTIPEAKAELVRALIGSGATDEADKALQSVPQGPDREFLSGAVSELKGNTEAAIKAYEAALEGDGEHIEAAFKLGVLLDRIGDDELAAEHYLVCADAWPAYLPGVLNLGMLYDERSESNAAVDCFRQVLAYNPRHRRAASLLRDARSSRSMFYDEKEERERERMEKIMRTSVNDFELSVRSRNCLAKMNIFTLGDLLRISESEMLSYKNFGETSLKEVREMLAVRGLRLGMYRDESEHGPTKADQKMLGENIEKLELTPRAAQVVTDLGITRIGDLAQYSDLDLYRAKGSGQSVVQEISTALGACGVSLRKPEVRF
ncbi:MAG: DNA-directed RNA polymerase subunit alpha C-terminal domain-containing protein [Planctomycetota bacterium]